MPKNSANKVTYELFYGSILDLPSSLILDMYEWQHAIRHRAVFVPRIKTFQCTVCPEEIRNLHCIENGVYCFNPPSEEVLMEFPQVDEQQMLAENVREKCIYNLVDAYDDEDRHIFFNYLYNIRFSCLELDGQITDTCSHKVMKNLGIDTEMVH